VNNWILTLRFGLHTIIVNRPVIRVTPQFTHIMNLLRCNNNILLYYSCSISPGRCSSARECNNIIQNHIVSIIFIIYLVFGYYSSAEICVVVGNEQIIDYETRRHNNILLCCVYSAPVQCLIYCLYYVCVSISMSI